MHSSRMCTAHSLTIAHRILRMPPCPPEKNTHAPPAKTTHAPSGSNHTCPPEQPRMPPSNHACPPEQPCMPPSNHTCPLSNHAHPPKQPHMPPPSNHTCPPEQPCTPPKQLRIPPQPTHPPHLSPRVTTHTPQSNHAWPLPVDRMTDRCKNITFTNYVCGQ